MHEFSFFISKTGLILGLLQSFGWISVRFPSCCEILSVTPECFSSLCFLVLSWSCRSFVSMFVFGFSRIHEKIVGSKNLLPSSSSWNSLYHLVSTFIGILLTFSPMHFLGFNVMPRRIPDFPDSFHSCNFLSSIGSGITLLSFAIFWFSGLIIWFLIMVCCWEEIIWLLSFGNLFV